MTNTRRLRADLPLEQEKKLTAEWTRLQSEQAELSYRVAGFARNLRSQFVPGASGDYQMRSWCVRNLGIGSMTASKLIVAAAAHKRLSYHDWTLLHHWSSIRFLMNLPGRAVPRMLKAAKAFKQERGRRPSYAWLVAHAFRLGFRSSRRGRPFRSETEAKAKTLRLWLDSLYENYNLPKPPSAVRDALRGARFDRATSLQVLRGRSA